MPRFTPTSSSWLNSVESWFGEITRKRIRRGVFKSSQELVAAMEEYIRYNNEDLNPSFARGRLSRYLKG